jgi:hypothetical protein
VTFNDSIPFLIKKRSHRWERTIHLSAIMSMPADVRSQHRNPMNR